MNWQYSFDPPFRSLIEQLSVFYLTFLIQKLSQFAQDTLLAGPALKVSQDLRGEIFGKLQKVELCSIEKLY